MKIATPEAAPNAFALTTTLARPVSGRSARPKTGNRRETAGIARKNGVEKNVSRVGAICPAHREIDVERIKRLVRGDNSAIILQLATRGSGFAA